MGAAAPLVQGSSGKMEVASEKINSAIRADFANRAAFFDRNPLIAEAMVDADVILVLRQGQIVKLNAMDQMRMGPEYPDQLINAKGKLLTLNSKELIDLGVADLRLFPTKLAEITEQEEQLQRWPFSKELLAEHPFFRDIPQATVVAYQMDWRTKFFTFLASPLISSLLFLGLIIGFYIELNTPGFGVAGGIAVTCLCLIILSSFALQAAPWLELIILLVGITLILIEIFFIPGFGFTGILGIILASGGLFGLLLPSLKDVHFELDTATLNAAGIYFFKRLAWLCGTLVVAVLIIALLWRVVMPKFGLFKRLVLKGEQEARLGYVAGADPAHLPKIGALGEVIAPLRPAGKVMIDDTLYDAISRGNFIDAGQKIEVVNIEGSKIVVDFAEKQALP